MTLWAVRKTSPSTGKFSGFSDVLEFKTSNAWRSKVTSDEQWWRTQWEKNKLLKTKNDTEMMKFHFHLPPSTFLVSLSPPKKKLNPSELRFPVVWLLLGRLPPKKQKPEKPNQTSPQSWGLGGVIRWNLDARGPWFPIFTGHQRCTTRAGTCISANFYGRNSAGWNVAFFLGRLLNFLIRWRRYF